MKKLIKLLLTALVICLSVTMVGAEENTFVFDGKDIKATEGGNTITEDVSGLYPGDVVTFPVTFTNDSAKDTNWYIEAEVLKTLEEESAVARDAGYTFKLDYADKDGNVLSNLFDSSKIGGDSSEGLKQATESTKDEYVYIDTLKEKETRQIILTIGLEGETQANDYQLTTGKFQIRFAVEVEEEVNTGDTNNLNMFTVMFGASTVLAVGALGYLLYLKKKEAVR